MQSPAIKTVIHSGRTCLTTRYSPLLARTVDLYLTYSGEIVSIRFTYPIIGQIESRAPSSQTPLITCVARQRTEHRLELVLTGATPPVLPSARLRQVTPKGMRGVEKVNHSKHNLNDDPLKLEPNLEINLCVRSKTKVHYAITKKFLKFELTVCIEWYSCISFSDFFSRLLDDYVSVLRDNFHTLYPSLLCVRVKDTRVFLFYAF